jgi:hypothetical protein
MQQILKLLFDTDLHSDGGYHVVPGNGLPDAAQLLH